MVGNFLGDFIRGTDLSHLPLAISEGVKLHRRIDAFTDAHPNIMRLKAFFPAEIRRFAGIALDVWFDHLLLNSSHHERLTNTILPAFYQQLFECDIDNPRYTLVKKSLLSGHWLADYKQQRTCLKAMSSVERRFSRHVEFAAMAYECLRDNKSAIKMEFEPFYQQLEHYCFEATTQVR